ncbi:MAG: tetratricopeptide repeat protein [Brachymonas sp.]|nr:tetratricopeptide repeat protein [Brachymonas sp.]
MLSTIRRTALILGLAALYTANIAVAADTPSTAQPTVSERMQNARDAIKANKWQPAIAELRIAVRDEPKNADAHNLLAYSYRKQAKPDLSKAFEHYKIALQLDPKHKGAHEYIGEAYLMDKKPDEAEKHLAELEKICGNKTCEEYADLAKAIAQFKVGK